MPTTNHLNDLLGGWQTIIMMSLLGLVLALIVSFVQPLRYSSTARLLILQSDSSVDAYTASRAEERIADNLSTIVYTSTFFDQVIKSGFRIDDNSFPMDPNKRRRQWGKTIDASVSVGSGLLTLTAYHQDVQQAEQLVRAVAFVLTDRVSEYTSGSNIQVRLVDEPLNSRWPVKPNVLANAVSGLFLGGFFGVLYVFIQTERIRRRHQLIHE